LHYITHRKNILNTDNKNNQLAGARKRKHGKWNKPWFTQININGKCKYLGSFKTEIEAHNKYMEVVNGLG